MKDMDKTSNRPSELTYRHIREPAEEIVEYIDNRRKGITRSLRTGWKKFNRSCMGGIEPNTIYTIAGISGSGKSALVNTLETDIILLNPHDDFVVLSFNFEMLSSKQVGRKLSYRLKKTVTELYSGNTNDTKARLSQDDYDLIVEHAKSKNSVDPSGARANHGDTVIAKALAWKLIKAMWNCLMLLLPISSETLLTMVLKQQKNGLPAEKTRQDTFISKCRKMKMILNSLLQMTGKGLILKT